MIRAKSEDFKVEDFYFFKIKAMWSYFCNEHPAFWCACGFLFFEYFRPQAIYPIIDFLPWSQLFVLSGLGLAFFDKKASLQFSYPTILVVLFLLQIEFSRLFSIYPDWSSNFHIQFFQWIVVYFLITINVTTRERLYIYLMIFFVCTLKISIGTAKAWAYRGFSFSTWGLMGPSGYFQNSGELAIQMLLLVALTFYLIKKFWSKSNNWERTVLFMAFLTPMMTIMGASSRGSQLALVALLFIFYWKSIYKPKVLIVIVTLLIGLLFLLPEEQKERFSSMGDDKTSVQRLLYWENGMDMIMKYPLTGVGLFNFMPYFADVYPEDVLFKNSRGKNVVELPHNIFIQIGTDGGVPALILYCLIILFCVFPKRVKGATLQQFNNGLGKGVLGFVIAGQFVSVAYYPFLWVSFSMVAAISQISNKSSKVSL